MDIIDLTLMPTQHPIEPALMVPYFRDIAPGNEYFMWLCADDSEHGPMRNASVVNQGCVCQEVGAIHQSHPSLVHLYVRKGLRDGAFYVPDTASA